MPDVILTSRSLRLRAAYGELDTVFLGQAKYNPRSIMVFSGRFRRVPATTAPRARMVHGGEKGMRDVNPTAHIIADSVKMQSRITTPNIARRGGVISDDQNDNRATTTVVTVAAPRVEELQVVAKWGEE